VRLQTLRHAAVGTHARSIDPTLILLAGVDASFDFDFNDYLHSASLCAASNPPQLLATRKTPDLLHFRIGNFLTSSVIIVSPVSGNRLRPHILGLLELSFQIGALARIDLSFLLNLLELILSLPELSL
jgi:hypothetical protein